MRMKKWIAENSWTLGYIAFILLYGVFTIIAFLCKEPILISLGVVFFAMTVVDLCIKFRNFNHFKETLKKKENNKE